MNLISIFSSPIYINRALELYDEHYSTNWQPQTKLDLYNQMTSALTPGLAEGDALKFFRPVYETLWMKWKLYREGCLSHWEATEALQHLTEISQYCDIESGLTLASLVVDTSLDSLLPIFDAFSGIKRQSSGDYPWVAASKFLHVFNPRLFPIYDISVIWNVALNGRFKEDYVQFCRRTNARPGERSARFNCTYTALAADLMQNSHSDLMPIFADWFQQSCSDDEDQNHLLDAIDTYYATAFEIILIGATKLR
jgi:hypothetical protein